jgi:hypothetical protein
MRDFGFGWGNYVSVTDRRLKAQKAIAKLRKQGRSIAPVAIEGRNITKNFWGKSWCSNLERYSDIASRLPRGRSYVCNGLVVDLQITKGRIAAKVSGSKLYDVAITIAAVGAKAVAIHVLRLRRLDRFVGGTPAGSPGAGSNGPGLSRWRRPVSRAGRNQILVHLSGLGRYVQARRGDPLWRRRSTRRTAPTAVRAARRRRRRIACRRRAGLGAYDVDARFACGAGDGRHRSSV